jgi:hypothetical protein
MSLIGEAWHAHRSGWDFSWLDGRTESTPLPWDYRERAQTLVRKAIRILDVDTGGGEFLASLAPLPHDAVAVESWPPNLPVALGRLGPLSARVIKDIEEDLVAMPIFDLVLSRHGRLPAAAISLRTHPGATLLTQQVGSRNQLELNEALGAPAPGPAEPWTLAVAVGRLEAAGFEIVDAREEMLPFRFLDIGAVVYQLAAVPWQIPGFEPAGYAEPLRRLDERISADGSFTVHDHRFLIEARRT